MTRQDFINGKPFVVQGYFYDFTYTENIFGGEVRISNGFRTYPIIVEEITRDYFRIDCWLNKHTDGKIYFKNCELK